MDKAKVNYSCLSIVQSYELKERLEKLEIKIYGMTIASVSDIDMYPSIKLLTTRKAVICFTRKLTAEIKKTIKLCLVLICFGMISTLIYLNGEYYKLHGGKKGRMSVSNKRV